MANLINLEVDKWLGRLNHVLSRVTDFEEDNYFACKHALEKFHTLPAMELFFRQREEGKFKDTEEKTEELHMKSFKNFVLSEHPESDIAKTYLKEDQRKAKESVKNAIKK